MGFSYVGTRAATALRSFHFLQRIELLEIEARCVIASVVLLCLAKIVHD